MKLFRSPWLYIGILTVAVIGIMLMMREKKETADADKTPSANPTA
jgi:hypothetical protein